MKPTKFMLVEKGRYVAVEQPTDRPDNDNQATEDAGRRRLLNSVELLWEQLPRKNEISPRDPVAVQRLKHALKCGDLLRARQFLDGMILDCAVVLNLSGVVFELEGNHVLAREYYQRALLADCDLGAAHLNLRRNYELYTFGLSWIPICL